MKKLTIKRLEDNFFICETIGEKEIKFFAIDTKEMPEGAKIKDKIEISDDGEITIL